MAVDFPACLRGFAFSYARQFEALHVSGFPSAPDPCNPSCMSEADETPTADARRGGFGVFAWVAMVLVVYVLSSGPVAKLIELKYLPSDPFVAFYSPVIWLAENFEPAADFLYWYLGHLWRVRF